MDSIIFLAYGAAYLALLAWYARLGANNGWGRAAMLPILVIAALAYDNIVLGSGKFIGEGDFLKTLNAGRYWLTVFTPLLFIWSVDALQRSGAMRHSAVKPMTWLIAAALVVTTFLREIQGLDLIPRDEYGSFSYISSAPAAAPLVPVIVAIVMLIAGGILWKRQKWPWLFLSSALMTVMSVVQLPIASNAATNLFELLLLTSVVATTAFQDRAGSR